MRRTVAPLTLQTLLALLVSPELQFIVAVEAGLLLSPRSGGLWVFTQAALVWLSSIVYPQLMSWVIPETNDTLRRFVGIGLFMLLAMLYNFFAFALGWLAGGIGTQTIAGSRFDDPEPGASKHRFDRRAERCGRDGPFKRETLHCARTT